MRKFLNIFLSLAWCPSWWRNHFRHRELGYASQDECYICLILEQ